MDGGTFDRLTRLLAGRLTRRAGLATAAAAAAAPAVADARRGGDGNGNGSGSGKGKDKGRGGGRGKGRDKDRGKDRRPRSEGPCGDGSRKANACMKDSQCCTGLCNMKRARRNEDGKGRCRCIQRGRACDEDRNCCGGRQCIDGLCGGQPSVACRESGAACATDAACCGGLSCRDGVCKRECVGEGAACASRGACCSGLACIEEACAACAVLGGACASDAACCDGLVCTKGACSACTPSVCETGCEYTTVAEAWAAASSGDTIYIGPGIYPTTIVIDKSMTLAACPGETGVELIPDRSIASPDSYFSVLLDDANDSTVHSVTVRNLTLRGSYETDTYDILLRSSFSELIDWTLEDVNLRNAQNGILAPNGNIQITGGEFTNCYYGAKFEYNRTDRDVSMKLVVKGLVASHCDSYGIYHFPYYDSEESVVDISNCTFRDNVGYGLGIAGDRPSSGSPVAQYSVTNCTFTGNQYAGLYPTGGHTNVTGCTFTYNPGSGRSAAVFPYDADVTLTDCLIAHNTNAGDDGGGIYIQAHERPMSTVTLAGTTVVTRNTADGGQGGGIYLSRQKAGVNCTIVGAGTRVSNNSPNDCYDGYTGQVVNCGTWQP